MKRVVRSALAFTFLLPLSLPAQPAPVAATTLPAARSLIDRHVAAVGGREAMLANSDGSIRSSMEIVETGMRGDLLLYGRGEDRLIYMTLPAMGETRMGRVGGVVWSMDPMNGPRLLEGQERRQMEEQIDPRFALRDAGLVESANTTALSDAQGRACYRVEIRMKSGTSLADCYSSEDGLLLSTESTTSTPMGELKQISHFSEYTRYGNGKAPKVTTMKVGGMTQIVRIQSYEQGLPDPALFVLPSEIEALVGKPATP